MKKVNVLIYPAGTEIGLEIEKSLRFSRHFNVIGANSTADHSEIVHSKLIADLPDVTKKPELIARIFEIIDEYGIEVIFPAHDEVIELFSANNWGHVHVVAPRPEAAKILRYKSTTYKALRGCEFLPQVYFESNLVDAALPLFARPDRGQGSVGVFKINTIEEAKRCFETKIPYIVTEFLSGPEYTVDCYTTRDRKLVFLSARERQRIRNGIAVRVKESDPKEFTSIAESINSRIPVEGPWFFQVKRNNDGCLKLMEVANRIAGSMGYQRLKGINLVQAAIWEALGKKVTLPKNRVGTFVYDRALQEGIRFDVILETIYVDLDDTLLFQDGTINYELIGYIFGLKYNKGTKVILITRHAYLVDDTLARMGIAAQFDEIIHLKAGESKADFVIGDRAAFIDDSHAERMAVACKNPNVLCIGPESQNILSGYLK